MLLIFMLLIPLICIYFFLACGTDGFSESLLVSLIASIKALSVLANDLDFSYDYHYSASYLDEKYSIFLDDDYHFLSDNGVSFIDERIVFVDGIASPDDARIRDNTIANGYYPAVSHQPYGRNLSAKLKQERNGSSQLPNNLVPAYARFIDVMCSYCWANYDPNRHYKNSITMRIFLSNLP